MSIGFARYTIGSVSEVLTAIKTALDATGMYDSVTISTNTLTVANDSKTYMTLSISSDTVSTAYYADGISGAAVSAAPNGNSYIWVGTNGDSVMIGIQGGMLLTTVLTKSKSGRNMIMFNTYTQAVTNGSLASDSSQVYYGEKTIKTTDMWSTLTSVGAYSQAESAVFSGRVTRYFEKLNAIPDPLTGSSGATYSLVTIGGKVYLTDGFFCMEE